jgi:hypothetical protein
MIIVEYTREFLKSGANRNYFVKYWGKFVIIIAKTWC